MKILHICLACFYQYGMGYQENILPRMHKQQGHQVQILAMAKKRADNGLVLIDEDYQNEDDIPVKILKIEKESFLYKINAFLRIYSDVYQKIEEFKPDIIFVHGGQSVSLKDVVKYCKKHREVKLYIDQHGDYYNSPINGFRRRITTKYVVGRYLRKSPKWTQKYWGTTPWRCQYLKEVYNLPEEKIGLLVMGGNDDKIYFEKMPQLRDDIRKKHNISNDDFVVVTGGRIDKTKNIHLLMQAVKKLNEKKIKLIVFGKPDLKMEPEIEELAKCENIVFLGWIPADEAYNYFLISDLAVFPGTHSVLWEQACACGIPCVFKDWSGMHHVDMGGNCEFLYNDSVEEISDVLSEIYNDSIKYQKMKNKAEEIKREFYYSEIAKRAIG